jgi:DNA-binding MarR family transcriptional regulator
MIPEPPFEGTPPPPAKVDDALDPDVGERGTLGFMSALWALDHALHRSSKRMAATLGVTGPQRLVLRLVGRHPSIAAGALARTLHLHPSTVTGVLARLEGSGLIRRTTDPADRRRTTLVLTNKGRRLYRLSSGTIEAAIDSALAQCGNGDAEAAVRVLQAVAAALREVYEAPKRIKA